MVKNWSPPNRLGRPPKESTASAVVKEPPSPFSLDSELPPIPDGAQPIATAPLTGQTVWLFNAVTTHGVRGKWRKSRNYVAKDMRWVVNNFWADPTTNKPLGATWTHWMPAT